MDDSIAAGAVERARQLLPRYAATDGYIGCFLAGSLVYPGAADAQSELDMIVLVADDAAARLQRRHHVVVDRGPPRRKEADVLFVAWSEQAAEHGSTRDGRHWSVSHARVVDDVSGRVTELLASIAHVSEEFATDRIKLHFLELHHCHGKALRMRDRDPINAACMVRAGAQAAVKTLAFLHRTWPPIPHWTVQGLRHAGVSADALDVVGTALVGPADTGLDSVLDVIGAQLDASGHSFHRDIVALDAWWWSPAGQTLAGRWGLGLM